MLVEVAGYITWFGIGTLASVKLARFCKYPERVILGKYCSNMQRIEQRWESLQRKIRENYKEIEENLVSFDPRSHLEIEYQGKPILITGKLCGNKHFYDYLKNPMHCPVVSTKGVMFSRSVYKSIRKNWIRHPQDGWEFTDYIDSAEATLNGFKVDKEILQSISFGTVLCDAELISRDPQWEYNIEPGDQIVVSSASWPKSVYKISYVVVPDNIDVSIVCCIDGQKLVPYKERYYVEEGIVDLQYTKQWLRGERTPKYLEEGLKESKKNLNELRETLIELSDFRYYKFSRIAWGIVAFGICLELIVKPTKSDK